MSVKYDSLVKLAISRYQTAALGIVAINKPTKTFAGSPSLVILLHDDWIERKDKVRLTLKEELAKIATSGSLYIFCVRDLWDKCRRNDQELLRAVVQGEILYATKFFGALCALDNLRLRIEEMFGEALVSFGLVGSMAREVKPDATDVDLFVILDDVRLGYLAGGDADRNRLEEELFQIALPLSKRCQLRMDFHTYLATDFLERFLRHDAFVLVLLREAIPLQDRGLFSYLHRLLIEGRARPSLEAVKNYQHAAEVLLSEAKKKIHGVISDDVYYAAITISQALQMALGKAPSPPKLIPEDLRRLSREGTHTLKEEDLKFLEDVILLRDHEKVLMEERSWGNNLKEIIRKAEKFCQNAKRAIRAAGETGQ